jgi:chromosome segregation ATPase
VVWDKIAEALRNPDLLIGQYARQAENNDSSNAQHRLGEIDRELNKLKRQRDRNLDLYVEEQLGMPTLKQRQEKLRSRMASLEREREALGRMLKQNNADMPTVSEFCQLVSQGLDAVTHDEKRSILRLLNIEGRVKDGVITLTGCIPSSGSCDYSTSQQPASR